MKLDIEAIEERACAATPGPWRACCEGNPRTCGMVWARSQEVPLCKISFGGGEHMIEPRREDDGVRADQRFIAHAREDIPTLIAEVRRLEAERDALRERISAECDILAEEFESDGIDWGEKLKCAMKTLDALREAVEE